MDPVGGLSLGVGLVFLSLIIHFVRNEAVSGRLDRNSAIGIRTKATRSSDAAWLAGHRAAGPWLLVTAITGYVAGLTAIVIAVTLMATEGDNLAVMIVPLAGFVAVIALLITAASKADSSAINQHRVTVQQSTGETSQEKITGRGGGRRHVAASRGVAAQAAVASGSEGETSRAILKKATQLFQTVDEWGRVVQTGNTKRVEICGKTTVAIGF